MKRIVVKEWIHHDAVDKRDALDALPNDSIIMDTTNNIVYTRDGKWYGVTGDANDDSVVATTNELSVAIYLVMFDPSFDETI